MDIGYAMSHMKRCVRRKLKPDREVICKDVAALFACPTLAKIRVCCEVFELGSLDAVVVENATYRNVFDTTHERRLAADDGRFQVTMQWESELQKGWRLNGERERKSILDTR